MPTSPGARAQQASDVSEGLIGNLLANLDGRTGGYWRTLPDQEIEPDLVVWYSMTPEVPARSVYGSEGWGGIALGGVAEDLSAWRGIRWRRGALAAAGLASSRMGGWEQPKAWV